MLTKILKITFIALTLMLLCACSVYFVLVEIGDKNRIDNQERFNSTKLSSEVVANLCHDNLIPIAIANCKNDRIDLRYKDIPVIIDKNVGETFTFEDIQNLFGRYLDKCETVAHYDYQYRCIYTIDGYHFRLLHFRNKNIWILTYPQDWWE